MTTDIDLDAIRRLTEAATPAPWTAHPDGLVWPERIGDPVSGSVLVEDAEFIAASRSAVPALLAEVNRLREQVFAQQPVIDAVQTWAEAHEESDHEATIRTTADLYDAVEQYRVMDLALTNARTEAATR